MINPNKFYQRTKLFTDILYEILKVESNYRTELSILNLKLLDKISEHKALYIDNKINNRSSRFDILRKSVHIKNTIKNIMHSSLKSNISNKSDDFVIIDKNEEQESFLDKILSEGLENLLTFYKDKHKLISKEVSNLGVILYNYSSQNKNNGNKFELINLEKNEKELNKNYSTLTMAKEKYFEKMTELELFFHNDETILDNNKDLNNGKLNTIKDIISINNIPNDEKSIENKKINEIKEFRKNYKKSIDDINNSKRQYISKINEICNEIQEFNIIENSMLYNIFKIYKENLANVLEEVNKYCLFYEKNKKLINDLNFEFSNILSFNDIINMNFQFEEYNPKFSDIHNKKDLSVIQKMQKLIGFEFGQISQNSINEINYNEKNNNVLFIILMDKFLESEKKLTEKEKSLLKGLFKQEKYISEFIHKLNLIRINKKIFYNKEKFDVLLDFFKDIYSKISFGDEKNHEIVKLLMIYSETFYYKTENKKIFLNNVLKMPPELNDEKFWIRYIEIEIEKEIKNHKDNKNKNKKAPKFEYIVLLSNITHLKEFIENKENLNNIIDYFKNKYKFSVDDYDVIKSQLNI